MLDEQMIFHPRTFADLSQRTHLDSFLRVLPFPSLKVKDIGAVKR